MQCHNNDLFGLSQQSKFSLMKKEPYAIKKRFNNAKQMAIEWGLLKWEIVQQLFMSATHAKTRYVPWWSAVGLIEGQMGRAMSCSESCEIGWFTIELRCTYVCHSNIDTVLQGLWIPIIKIRRSHDRLIFVMAIPVLVIRRL